MRRLALVLALVLVAAGCRASEADPAPSVPTVDRAELAGLPWLTLNDHPKVSVRGGLPAESYNRARDWMPDGWTDPDHNGCDTREDTLIRDSLTPVHCVRGRVSPGGRWSLVYVAGETSEASVVQIDHVAALGDAWRSGGWAWPVERMRAYAQDPAVVLTVDGHSNQSKSDDGPDVWRPENPASFCTYAQRYVRIKAAYGLTVTRAELRGLRSLLTGC